MTSNFKVIFHSRKKFYEGTPIYWYEFECSGITNLDRLAEFNTLIPKRFLRVPSTIYYEYGGTHEEAIVELTAAGFVDIIESNEL